MSLASPSSYTNEDANPFSGGISVASVTRERQGRNVRKRRICLVWGCLILAILLVVLSLTGAIVLRYTLGSYDDEYQMFPGDSRIAHVPSDFCEELTTTSESGSLQLEVAQIKSVPSLTNHNETFTLKSSFEVSSSETSKTFVLHVHQGSTVNLINQTSGSVWTFVLYGDQSYQSWVQSECKKTCFTGSSHNGAGNGNENYYLNIPQELNLYLVFWREGDMPSVNVNLTAELNLTGYQTNSSSSLPSCTVGAKEQSKQCSLPVPYTSNSASTLFLVSAVGDSTFSQTESVMLTCKQRVWIYFVFVAPAIVLLLTSICIFITHCCCLIREKRRTAASLPELLANDNDADWLNEL